MLRKGPDVIPSSWLILSISIGLLIISSAGVLLLINNESDHQSWINFIGYFLGSILENSLKLKGGYYSTGNFRRKFTDDKLQLNLLSLAAIVIKADGKVDDRELNFVRNYFISISSSLLSNLAIFPFNGIFSNF